MSGRANPTSRIASAIASALIVSRCSIDLPPLVTSMRIGFSPLAISCGINLPHNLQNSVWFFFPHAIRNGTPPNSSNA